MKYIFDHSKDKEFEKAELEPSYKAEWDLFLAFRAKLTSPPFVESRVALFYELAKAWDASAHAYGTELEIMIKDDYQLASLTWRGQWCETFRMEESPTKTALLLGLQNANLVSFKTKGGNLEIYMYMNLWA